MTLCLAPELLAEVQRLQREVEDIELADLAADEDETPRRMSEPARVPNPRAAQIRQQMIGMLDQMAEHEGELTLRANLTNGEWRRFCNEHPARTKDEPGFDRDKAVSFGYCNADALIENLAKFAHAWDGDRLADGDWAAVFAPVVAPPDENDMARTVVGMYESRMDFQEWRNGLSASLKRSIDSEPPLTSGSPTADSTAGNPGA